MQYVSSLGEIGAVGGVLRPYQFTVDRDGAVWDLTGYTAAVLHVWELRTKATVAVGGSAVITSAAAGVVTYTPSVGDPLHANSGQYEGRLWLTSPGGDPEPSGMFRFSIAAGP